MKSSVSYPVKAARLKQTNPSHRPLSPDIQCSEIFFTAFKFCFLLRKIRMMFHSLSGPLWNTSNFLPKFSHFCFLVIEIPFFLWNFLPPPLFFTWALDHKIFWWIYTLVCSGLLGSVFWGKCWVPSLFCQLCLRFLVATTTCLHCLGGVWNVWDPRGMFSPLKKVPLSLAKKTKEFRSNNNQFCDIACLKLDCFYWPIAWFGPQNHNHRNHKVLFIIWKKCGYVQRKTP